MPRSSQLMTNYLLVVKLSWRPLCFSRWLKLNMNGLRREDKNILCQKAKTAFLSLSRYNAHEKVSPL